MGRVHVESGNIVIEPTTVLSQAVNGDQNNPCGGIDGTIIPPTTDLGKIRDTEVVIEFFKGGPNAPTPNPFAFDTE